MELPEVMIQHIHPFLNAKEVARTSVLSKSWYEAWLTSPNLDFSEQDFHFQSDFMEVVKRTLERYERLKLNIQRFRLVLKYLPNRNSSVMFVGYYSDIYYVAIEWINKAIKLGATDVDIEICQESNQNFVLPREVVESESFVKSRYGIQDLKVSCSKLNSLNLCEVCILDCGNLSKYRSSTDFNRERRFVLGVNGFHKGFNKNRRFVLRKLKVLSLYFVAIDEWIFRELSKSHCLKKLTLVCCTDFEEIQICSNSLEFIHLENKDHQRRMLRAKFDIPRIRKFIFTSYSCVPCLSFKTTSLEWKSCISFVWRNVYSSWFLNLSIDVYLRYMEGEYMNDNKMVRASLPKPPIVKKLSLRMDASFSLLSILIENLFWICRPKFITGSMSYNDVKLLCITLVKEECPTLHDLEKVDVEISGQSVWTWSRLLPRKTLDYSQFQARLMDTLVYFKWR